MGFVTNWSVGVRRQLRILTIVDCATREALDVEVDDSMPSSKVALRWLDSSEWAASQPRSESITGPNVWVLRFKSGASATA